MLDNKILSTSDLSKKHHITTRQIQKLAKKAIESGNFNILLESKEYRVSLKKRGKGYSFQELKKGQVVELVNVVDTDSNTIQSQEFFSKKDSLDLIKDSCSEEPTTTTTLTTSNIKELESKDLALFEDLPSSDKEKAFIKKKIIQEFKEFEGTFKEFEEYITHLYSNEINSHKIGISYNQIKRFKEAYESKGLLGLLDKRGRAKGSSWKIDESIIDEVKSIFLAHKGNIRAKNIYRIVNANAYKKGTIPKNEYLKTTRGKGGVISYTRINEIINEIKESREYAFLLNPDRFKNYYLPAFGDAREKALYANHYWEIDSTQLDSFGVLGGKESTWNLISISDIKTSMKVIGIVKNSNSQAISELLYKAFLKLGIPENIVTDNGKDYLSNHTLQILEEWGIKHIRTAPFSGEQKPFVERHFGTIQNSFTELLKGFKGHSVTQFQSIKSQTSVADRLSGKAQKVEAEKVEVLAQKLDEWIDNVYCREYNSSLGASPYEMYLQDEDYIKRANIQNLAYMFCKKELVKVGKKGIRKNKKLYNSQSGLLGNRVGDELKIIIDPYENKRCFMFEMDGTFIGIATDEKISYETAKEAKTIYKEELKQIVGKNRKLVSQYKDRDFTQEIIEANKEAFKDSKAIELIGGSGLTQNSGNVESLSQVAKNIEQELKTSKELKEQYVAWEELTQATKKEERQKKPQDYYEDIYAKKIAY